MDFQQSLMGPRKKKVITIVTWSTPIQLNSETTIVDINLLDWTWTWWPTDWLLHWDTTSVVCSTSNADANISWLHHITSFINNKPFASIEIWGVNPYKFLSIIKADWSTSWYTAIVIES